MKNATLFAQIMQTVDRSSFTKLVGQHGTDKHSKSINSWAFLVTMLFCQFSKLISLRDVCNGLQSTSENLNSQEIVVTLRILFFLAALLLTLTLWGAAEINIKRFFDTSTAPVVDNFPRKGSLIRLNLLEHGLVCFEL